MTDELETVINRLGEGYQSLLGRVEQMELAASRPRNPAASGGQRMTQEQRDHVQAFTNWMRQPKSQQAMAELERAQMAIDTSSNTSGGFAVPEILGNEIVAKLKDMSPLRRIARVVQVGSSDYKEIISVGGSSSGWAGEGDERTETDTPEIQEVAPTFGTVYAYPKASEESFQDMFFNVQEWLVDEVSEDLSTEEGAAFVSGNGTKKPTGFLNATPEAVGDEETSPERTFGALEYVPTGVSDGFGTLSTGSPENYPADVLWTTVYTLRSRYRQNGRWLMNSSTASVIRKFKDADGNYLWRDGLVEGQPPLLCGYPVEIDDVGMPDIGTNAFPVAFGDFRRGYLIADVQTLRVTVDNNITEPGQIKFYVRKRVGGKTKDCDAIKLIKCATS